jgi:hypothetical protein
MADLKEVYSTVSEEAALNALDKFWGEMEFKVPQDSWVLAYELGQSQYLFQVPAWDTDVDIYDQRHRGLQ